MAIFNCTPHRICIYKEQDVDMSNPRRLFVKEGAEPYVILEPCETILNAKVERVHLGLLEEGIPCVGQKFTEVDNPLQIPDSQEDDCFIVSALYKTAFRAVHGEDNCFNLLTVDSVIYNDVDNPRPCGCLNLAM